MKNAILNSFLERRNTLFSPLNLSKYINPSQIGTLNKNGGHMITILFRTVIIYILLTLTMRLMGKRQLGELDVGELVITILLSEIATTPITNPDRPLIESVMPIVVLALLEILTSLLILKIPFFKSVLSSKPAVLIKRGELDFKMIKKVRISLEELVSQIRQNGIYDLCEVDYAILEENGKMSVIPKNANRQPDKSDIGITCPDNGIMHIVISDGCVNSHSLFIINKDRNWINGMLKTLGISINNIFCMTVDDAGKIFIQTRDGKQIIR